MYLNMTGDFIVYICVCVLFYTCRDRDCDRYLDHIY